MISTRITIILYLLLLFSPGHNLYAQNEELRFDHIGFEQGLSNDKVTNIFQDSKGYIWIGTFDGLNKYDGYTFTQYKYDPFDSNSISQNFIYSIFEDKYGIIWVSSFEGLCKFDLATEKFTRYKPSPNSRFSNPNISAINEGIDGMLWVGNFTGGLCRFDRLTGQFLPDSFDLEVSHMADESSGFSDAINCIYRDRAGTLWIGNRSGLHKINLTAVKQGQPSSVSLNHYHHDPLNPKSLSGNLVSSIFEDKDGLLWVATNNGLNSLDRKAGSFKRYQHDPKIIQSISTNNLRDFPGGGIKEDLEGNLWIRTNNGLNKLNKERTTFSAYFHNPDDVNSISSDIIYTLEIDKAGILWVGSWTGKLNKANLNDKGFRLRRHDPNYRNSLSSNEVTGIVEDSSGIVWIGTYTGGLNRWDKKSNQFTHYRHDPSNPKSLRFDAIAAIMEDRHGRLWVCNGDILSQFNKQTAEFTHYDTRAKNNKEGNQRSILSIAEDQQGFLWLGTVHGIIKINVTTGELVHYDYNPADTNGISDGTAQAVFTDSRDNIWIGYGSIAMDKFNKKTGRFKHYKHDPKDSTSISSNIVNCFYEDSKGNLWLGTDAGGLCYFDYQKELFTAYTTKHGLPDNTVFSILNDNTNHLWLGTGNGLSRFDPVTKSFINYDYKDGLQSNFLAAGERDRGARFKGKDGTLYFGGNNGFNFFDPLKLKTNSILAPIVITQFKLFDQLVKGANESKEIILQFDQNYFSFEFSSLSYYNPAKNQYKYKLEGVDKEWVSSGSRHYAGYTDVGPGHYTFRVKGTNYDGVWNEKGTSISLLIKPPWWSTWWAYSFYGVCFIGLLVLLVKNQRVRIIKRERERTRERELEQGREIEKAYHALKSTQDQLIQAEKMASLGELTAGIAHEIKNPLNFINNFSEINLELLTEIDEHPSSKDAEAMPVELQTIKNLKKNSEKINHHGKRVDSIVKGMLLHSRLGGLNKEPIDINALCEETIKLAYHGYRAKEKTFNAAFETRFDPDLPKVNGVPQDLGRVILNIINNALYAVHYKKRMAATDGRTDQLESDAWYKPYLILATRKTDHKISITISDNGQGISSQNLAKIFQPFFTTKPTGEGTGLGLSMAYDIITKGHGGELKVKSREGEGTDFEIILPVDGQTPDRNA